MSQVAVQSDFRERSFSFKNKGKDASASRQQRAATTVELRKNKRDEHLNKKRNVIDVDELDDATSDSEVEIEIESTPTEFSVLAANLSNPDLSIKLQAVHTARKLLSRTKNPPINEFILSGILPRLIECLAVKESVQIQFEAAWALTNIASGTSEQTTALVNQGAVPYFVNLLDSPNVNVCDQVVWALGNIIGDGPKFRDLVLSFGFLPKLLGYLERDIPITFLRNITWVLVNLCRCKNPPLQPDTVLYLLPTFSKLIGHTDLNVLVDTLWGISYLTDSGGVYIQMIINGGFVPRLVELLDHSDVKVDESLSSWFLSRLTDWLISWFKSSPPSSEPYQKPIDSELLVHAPHIHTYDLQTASLRALGNIVTGTDEQTQHVLNCNILQKLPQLLCHPREKINKEAVWLLSNITAGSTAQIQAVINAGVVPLLVHHLRADFLTQKEAVWAIGNIAVSGTIEQVNHLMSYGVICSLCDLLSAKDPQVVQVVLNSLTSMLKLHADNKEARTSICLQIEECGGLDRIEGLQAHDNLLIYKSALALITNYFDDEEEEDVFLAPGSDVDSYKFNIPEVPVDAISF